MCQGYLQIELNTLIKTFEIRSKNSLFEHKHTAHWRRTQASSFLVFSNFEFF